MALNGLRFLLHLRPDTIVYDTEGNMTDNLCGNCLPHIRFSGECHEYNCSHGEVVNSIVREIELRIFIKHKF